MQVAVAEVCEHVAAQPGGADAATALRRCFWHAALAPWLACPAASSANSNSTSGATALPPWRALPAPLRVQLIRKCCAAGVPGSALDALLGSLRAAVESAKAGAATDVALVVLEEEEGGLLADKSSEAMLRVRV